MDEEEFRDLIGKSPLPFGAKENPDAVLKLWEAWEASGIQKPVDLDAILDPANGEDHTQLVFREVVECIRSMETPEPLGKLIFWQAPHGKLEAFVKPLGEEGHVVVLDQYLNGALSFTAFSAMACGFERPSEEEIQRITAGVFRHVDQFLGRGDRDLQEELVWDMLLRSHHGALLGGYVKLGLCTFLLAHELAHVVLGHTLRIPGESIGRDGAASEVDHAALDRKEEFEADEFAVRVYRELSKDTEKWLTIKLEELYASVPLFLFDFLEVFYRRHEFVKGCKLSDSSHPLPLERKKHLLALFPDMRNEVAESLYGGLLEFAEHLVEGCEDYPPSLSRLPDPPDSPL